MIARIWHGAVPATRADEYGDYLKRTGVPDSRATDGNRGVLVSRKIDGEVAHFLFVSFWESEAAIRRFAGDDIEKARYYPEDEQYLLDLEPTVQHYDVLVYEGDE